MIRQAAYQSKRYADRFVKVSTTVPVEHAQRFCALLPEVVAAALQHGDADRALY